MMFAEAELQWAFPMQTSAGAVIGDAAKQPRKLRLVLRLAVPRCHDATASESLDIILDFIPLIICQHEYHSSFKEI